MEAAASPVFVVGGSRSGTTLLRMMLCAHPRIHLTLEASFYVWGGLYPVWRDPDGFPPFYLRTFSFRWLGLGPEPVLADLPRPFTRRDRPLLYTAVMRAAADRHGKPRWGDKTPGHAGRLAQIFADYPDARVIRMTRDPRDAVDSLIHMPWSSPSLVAAAAQVDLERRQVRPFRHRLLEVRLADLLATPEPAMRRVLDFVGEPWSDQVLDHPAHAPDDLPPLPWFRSAGRAVGAGVAASRLDGPAVRLVECLSRRALAEQGLGPRALAVEPSWAAIGWRYLADLPLAVRSAALGVRLLAAALADDPARTEVVLRKLNPAAWAALGPDFRMPEPPAIGTAPSGGSR